jgi:uncharacterized protein (DUF952 family)
MHFDFDIDHIARDQQLVVYIITMPRLIGKSAVVVDVGSFKIEELAGNVASKNDTLSIAKVVVSQPCSEPWLTLDYDEWICVTFGYLELHSADGEVLTVKAGETAYVEKGERFRPIFPIPTEYIPVCLPAFKPERCHREEDGVSDVSARLQELHSSAKKQEASGIPIPTPVTLATTNTDDDRSGIIYHMCEKTVWEQSIAAKQAYFPPTFTADGFTHATAVPARLLDTANHFYTSSKDEWLCLKLSQSALYQLGIVTVLEEPKPVGEKDVQDQWKTSDWRCPHIFGGIPGHVEGVVTKTYSMKRDDDGRFLAIEGLCE